MRKQSYAAMVNHIITDPQLYPSTKRVFFAMLCHCSRHNTVRKSVAELAVQFGGGANKYNNTSCTDY